jgi:hypothetical protein
MLHDGGKRLGQLEERLKETPPVEIDLKGFLEPLRQFR